ncbi:hypothetical protein H9S87_13750 [Bacillus pumilus]|uniref:LCI fold-containing protein n=1 Tax=Bacillus pumilus TaxID=1408 RepID=UPI001657DBAD|nr:LCI fold-containing protein [Bacillus pumilus]QNP15583.1 hypothetical protein H9S87_13750 [Bacillus pumilus]
MKIKKIIASSSLSLILLVSATPAFAANPIQESITPQAVLQDYYLGAKTRAELKNVIPVFGTNFYLKDAWQNSDGSWTGFYQGWI